MRKGSGELNLVYKSPKYIKNKHKKKTKDVKQSFQPKTNQDLDNVG